MNRMAGKSEGEATVFPFDEGSEFDIEERCFIVEMLSSSDDNNCSIARARVEPGVTTALHSLKGVVERYIILEGEGDVRVGAAAARRVGPLDVVRIDAGQPQSITNPSADRDLLFLCVCTPGFTKEVFVNLEND